MLETTKIRREGFAVRPVFQEFVDKYASLGQFYSDFSLYLHLIQKLFDDYFYRYRILVRLPNIKPDAEGCKLILLKVGCRGWCVG